VGFRDHIRGITRPDPEVLPVDPEELRVRLMRLSQPSTAWQVRDGAREKVDLVAEWKTDDPYWHEILTKARVNKTFQTYLRFHPTAHEVRSRDRCFSGDQWAWGDGGSSFGPTWQEGQLHERAQGKVNGQHYQFDTADFKNVLKKTVTDAGWIYRAVVMRKL
jgi:hypothetical protein